MEIHIKDKLIDITYMSELTPPLAGLTPARFSSQGFRYIKALGAQLHYLHLFLLIRLKNSFLQVFPEYLRYGMSNILML